MAAPRSYISVIDDSIYSEQSTSCIPLIVFATAANKVSDSGDVYSGTAESKVVRLISGLNDLYTRYGTPIFEINNGTVNHASEMNEVGLKAAADLLGVNNTAYVVRADIDLNQLAGTDIEPTANVKNGTYWFDTLNTVFGVFRANGNTNRAKAWDLVDVKVPYDYDIKDNEPAQEYGDNRDVAYVAVKDENGLITNTFFEKVSGSWLKIGSDAWKEALKDSRTGETPTVTFASHINVPAGTFIGSIWIKTTKPNYGSDYSLKRFASATNLWNITPITLYKSLDAAELAMSTGVINTVYAECSPDDKEVAIKFYRLAYNTGFEKTITNLNPTTNTIRIRVMGYDKIEVTGTVEECALAISASAIPGLSAAAVNETTMKIVSDSWHTVIISTGSEASEQYDPITEQVTLSGFDTFSDGTISLDTSSIILTNWEMLEYVPSLTEPRAPALDGTYWFNNEFDVDIMVNDGDQWLDYPKEIYVTSADPTIDLPKGKDIEADDLWINPSLKPYPVIKRFNSEEEWELIDNSDQSSPAGIVFADARSDVSKERVNYVDPDCIEPAAYPAGILLFNTRYSTYNVKEYKKDLFADYVGKTYKVGASEFVFEGDTSRWVTASGNKVNGEPYMGPEAQRIMVVRALQEALNMESLRVEDIYFNLIATPGYVECYDEMIVLNQDRKETAFIVTDTPKDLAPDASAVQAWLTNKNVASTNGSDGLVNRYTYSWMTYPGLGMGSNTDGYNVAVPSSSILLRQIATCDAMTGGKVWLPAAGVRRGLVSNASSVGYIDDEGEYRPISVNEGLRDVLFDNGCNSIRNVPSYGLTVWGDKTLQGYASALDSMGVARLVCKVRKDVDTLVIPYFFELNTPYLRQQVQNVISGYLTNLMNQEALQDYVVVCDGSNNTEERVAAYELHVDLAFLPYRSIRWIYAGIRIVNTESQLSA